MLNSLPPSLSLSVSPSLSPGPIHMDNVFCVGTESALFDCSFNGFDNHNCRHSEDAGVICSSEFTE